MFSLRTRGYKKRKFKNFNEVKQKENKIEETIDCKKYLDRRTIIKMRIERELEEKKNHKCCTKCFEVKMKETNFYKTGKYYFSICKTCCAKNNKAYHDRTYKQKNIVNKLSFVDEDTFKNIYNDLQLPYRLHQVYNKYKDKLDMNYNSFKYYYKKNYFKYDHYIPRTKKNYNTFI